MQTPQFGTPANWPEAGTRATEYPFGTSAWDTSSAARSAWVPCATVVVVVVVVVAGGPLALLVEAQPVASAAHAARAKRAAPPRVVRTAAVSHRRGIMASVATT
jgi:hypothetical protein